MPIKKIFKSNNDSTLNEKKINHVTVAVLLFKLIRTDGKAKMLELVHMSELLRKEFGLAQAELEMVFKVADDQESKEMDIDSFIAKECQGLGQQAKIRLLEHLWVLAFADDKIEEREVSLIKKVAQRLELSEIEQVTAQENAEKHLGLDLF